MQQALHSLKEFIQAVKDKQIFAQFAQLKALKQLSLMSWNA